MCATDTTQLIRDINMVVDRAFSVRELPYVSNSEVSECLVGELVRFLRIKKAHWEELQRQEQATT